MEMEDRRVTVRPLSFLRSRSVKRRFGLSSTIWSHVRSDQLRQSTVHVLHNPDAFVREMLLAGDVPANLVVNRLVAGITPDWESGNGVGK